MPSSRRVHYAATSHTASCSRSATRGYADIDNDGTLDRFNLFNSALTDYFWQYDNTGLKLAQLRFYEIPTTVSSP